MNDEVESAIKIAYEAREIARKAVAESHAAHNMANAAMANAARHINGDNDEALDKAMEAKNAAASAHGLAHTAMSRIDSTVPIVDTHSNALANQAVEMNRLNQAIVDLNVLVDQQQVEINAFKEMRHEIELKLHRLTTGQPAASVDEGAFGDMAGQLLDAEESLAAALQLLKDIRTLGQQTGDMISPEWDSIVRSTVELLTHHKMI